MASGCVAALLVAALPVGQLCGVSQAEVVMLARASGPLQLGQMERLHHPYRIVMQRTAPRWVLVHSQITSRCGPLVVAASARPSWCSTASLAGSVS